MRVAGGLGIVQANHEPSPLLSMGVLRRLSGIWSSVHERYAVLLSRVERVPGLGRIPTICVVLHVVQHLSRKLDVIVCELAQLIIVNTELLLLGRDTQA